MAREWYNRPVNSGYTYVDGVTTGNYNNGVPNTYVKTWMEYLVIQNDTDKANNRSRIDVKLYSQVIDGGSSTGMSSATTANNYGYVGFDNANQQYLNTTYNFNNFALNKFADATLTIPHNADGTKTITLQGAFQTLSGTWAITGGSASASVTLPAIDVYKPTTMASFTGQNYGYQSTLVLDRKASNLRENVTLSYGGTTLTLKTTSSADTTITFTVDRQYTPNTTKPSPSDWTLTITTYNGSTLIGTMTYTKQFTIRSDDTSYAPTLTAQPVASAYNDVVSALGNDTIVVGYSKLRISANKANVSLKYGATIPTGGRYVRFFGRYNIGGVDDSTFTSNVVEAGDSVIWSYVVTDSRGFQVVVMDSYPYTMATPPTITIQECYRGLSDQTASESGTYIWVKAVVNYPSYNNHNSCTLKAQATGFSQVTLTSGTRTAIVTSASAQNAYTVTFTATDIITTTTNTRQIPSEDVPIHIREGGKGVGIGAYCEGEGLISVGYQFSGAIKSKGDRIFGTCNLADINSLEQGSISGTGVEADASTRVRSGWDSVKANTTYTVSVTPSNLRIMSFRYYNSAKTLLSNYDPTYSDKVTFTTPNNCAFVRVVFGNSTNTNVSPSAFSTFQIEKGSSASPYVPYAMDNVELTERTASQKIYFTPTNCSARDVFGGCFYYKENGTVHLHIGANNPSSTSDFIQLGTMPVGYRPDGYACQIGHGGSAFGIAKLLVSDTGQIRLATQGGDIVVELVYKAKD